MRNKIIKKHIEVVKINSMGKESKLNCILTEKCGNYIRCKDKKTGEEIILEKVEKEK